MKIGEVSGIGGAKEMSPDRDHLKKSRLPRLHRTQILNLPDLFPSHHLPWGRRRNRHRSSSGR